MLLRRLHGAGRLAQRVRQLRTSRSAALLGFNPPCCSPIGAHPHVARLLRRVHERATGTSKRTLQVQAAAKAQRGLSTAQHLPGRRPVFAGCVPPLIGVVLVYHVYAVDWPLECSVSLPLALPGRSCMFAPLPRFERCGAYDVLERLCGFGSIDNQLQSEASSNSAGCQSRQDGRCLATGRIFHLRQNAFSSSQLFLTYHPCCCCVNNVRPALSWSSAHLGRL